MFSYSNYLLFEYKWILKTLIYSLLHIFLLYLKCISFVYTSSIFENCLIVSHVLINLNHSDWLFEQIYPRLICIIDILLYYSWFWKEFEKILRYLLKFLFLSKNLFLSAKIKISSKRWWIEKFSLTKYSLYINIKISHYL